ncbi:hypothetical protein GCM10023084_63450 [Streptomyces lacrimifluminis]|uniref:Uncharacterized protein n=1 Tax=Streptomyces lacrimifluminis TaxID=1500077 RepID=A0A917P2N9_9ACTN|nr:hypothetical protein [Streptomyces lacrimifluminis]GGJ57261.1 hypothetical protein GCM10012282_63100 [Streptomyces lacrimifluminis]
MENESNLSLTLITIDRASSSTVASRLDGNGAWQIPTPSLFEDTSVVAKLEFSPALPALLVTTLAGDQILFELPLQRAADQLEGRLVVYLDQNQWSTLSNACHDLRKSSEEDQAAGRKLRDWVEQRRIILPSSSSHYFETGKRFSTESATPWGSQSCSTAGVGRCVTPCRSGETSFTMPSAIVWAAPATSAPPQSSPSIRMPSSLQFDGLAPGCRRRC